MKNSANATTYLAIILFSILMINISCTCTSHQYLDPSTGQCLFCDISCSTCQGSALNCTGCSPNFFQDTNGTCSYCPNNCTSCTSLTHCTSCRLGFYLSSSDCLSCGQNCMFCNSTHCSTCRVGYNKDTNCSTCAN